MPATGTNQRLLFETFDLFRSCYYVTCPSCGREILTDDQKKRFRLVRDLVGEAYRDSFGDVDPVDIGSNDETKAKFISYLVEIERVAVYTCGQTNAEFIVLKLKKRHLSD